MIESQVLKLIYDHTHPYTLYVSILMNDIIRKYNLTLGNK